MRFLQDHTPIRCLLNFFHSNGGYQYMTAAGEDYLPRQAGSDQVLFTADDWQYNRHRFIAQPTKEISTALR